MTSRLICLIWGHAVDNRAFLEDGRACTRCGQHILRNDPAPVRIGHTLSCFVRWVSFVRPRGQFSEYACVTSGHPFLFAQRRHLRAVA